MNEMSVITISNRETSMLRSKEKASKLCSLLCAYRLLDVIVSLSDENESTPPPVHKRMGVNIFDNEVRSHLIFLLSSSYD